MDSDVTFWHRHRAKSEAKIAPLDRPGHAVSPLRGCAGPGVYCNLRKHWAGNHGFQRIEAGPKTLLVRNGFRRDVLTSEPGEKWGENSFPGPAWPCGFTVATCFFVSRWNCKNQVTEVGSRTEAGAKTFLVLNGFRRDVLTSAPGEKWGENSSLGPARPCCFPAPGLRWPRRVLQSEEALGWKPWFPKNRSWTKNLTSS